MTLSALAASFASGCATRASVRAEIEIAAPPAIVWQIVRDLDRYGEWNPFTTRVDGALAEGAQLVLHVALRPGKRPRLQRQRVIFVEEGHGIVWETKLGTRQLLTARRVQRLSALDGGGTRYESTDSFQGGLVPLVMGLYRRDLERGFAAMAQALKQRAEAIARSR